MLLITPIMFLSEQKIACAALPSLRLPLSFHSCIKPITTSVLLKAPRAFFAPTTPPLNILSFELHVQLVSS